ncbi:hypothetical protein Sjap_014288 [Stephania japonica]|uniref:Biogenesis of lysosome-related organelles complex 1 subunit 1 n=1 Tax=Stephania japonica TaxID=461633 RepID=A0AAP0IZK2_9MAGN
MERNKGSSSGRSTDTNRGLEESLLHLVNLHNQNSSKLRERTERAKKEALRDAIRVSDLLVDRVDGGVQQCFANEKRIEHEIRALTGAIMRYSKQTDQWLAASHAINSALKEIGDFENWMKVMDYDCKSITNAIHAIHKP